VRQIGLGTPVPCNPDAIRRIAALQIDPQRLMESNRRSNGLRIAGITPDPRRRRANCHFLRPIPPPTHSTTR